MGVTANSSTRFAPTLVELTADRTPPTLAFDAHRRWRMGYGLASSTERNLTRDTHGHVLGIRSRRTDTVNSRRHPEQRLTAIARRGSGWQALTCSNADPHNGHAIANLYDFTSTHPLAASSATRVELAGLVILH